MKSLIKIIMENSKYNLTGINIKDIFKNKEVILIAIIVMVLPY